MYNDITELERTASYGHVLRMIEQIHLLGQNYPHIFNVETSISLQPISNPFRALYLYVVITDDCGLGCPNFDTSKDLLRICLAF